MAGAGPDAGPDGVDSSRFVPDGSVLATWGDDGAAEQLRDRCVVQALFAVPAQS